MVSSRPGLKTIRLKTPVDVADLKELEIGNVVYLDGRIFTGREGVLKRAVEQGHGLPAPIDEIGNVNFHCSPAAAVREDGSYVIGAVTATASFRFANWLDDWFAMSGCKIIIGKGGMGPNTLKACQEHAAVYFHAIGGAASLIAQSVKEVTAVHKLDFGVPEAMWVIRVEDFPVVVTMDSHGQSIHDQVEAKSQAKLAELIGL